LSRNVLAIAARESLRILRWQLGWIAALALTCGIAFGARAGWSALAGGGIGLVWTLYMAATLFRHSLTHGAHLSVVSFAMGWLIKVALTIALLIAAFRSPAVAPLALLGGLFGALAAYWAWLTFRANNNADGRDGK
jgi:ATP synthase protein I